MHNIMHITDMNQLIFINLIKLFKLKLNWVLNYNFQYLSHYLIDYLQLCYR